MDIFTVMVVLAMLASVAALVAGVSSMACDGEVGHLNSGQWMVRRVLFQGTAFLLLMLSLALRD